MARTEKEYKGKKYTPRKRDGRSKPKRDKKFFGHTKGEHSRGVTEIEIVDGKVVYTKTDKAPVKGEDFVKHGYPMETRSKKVLKNLAKEKDAKNQIKRINEEED